MPQKPITNEIILCSGATVAPLATADTAPRTNELYESFTGQPLPDGGPTSQDEHALVMAGNEFVETLTDEEFLHLYAIMTRVHPTIVRRLSEKVQLEQARFHKEEVDARFNGMSNQYYKYTQQ